MVLWPRPTGSYHILVRLLILSYFFCYNRIFTCELIYNLYHLLVSTITYCCIKIIHFKEKCFTQRSRRRRLHWKKDEGQSGISFKSFPSHNMIIVITMALIVPPLIKRCIQLVLDSRKPSKGGRRPSDTCKKPPFVGKCLIAKLLFAAITCDNLCEYGGSGILFFFLVLSLVVFLHQRKQQCPVSMTAEKCNWGNGLVHEVSFSKILTRQKMCRNLTRTNQCDETCHFQTYTGTNQWHKTWQIQAL